jgi:hypothetical protein
MILLAAKPNPLRLRLATLMLSPRSVSLIASNLGAHDLRAVDRNWVTAAAERAEQRLRGEMPRYVSSRQSADRGTTPATQLHALIAAIMNPQVTRKGLRQLAEALKTSRVS